MSDILIKPPELRRASQNLENSAMKIQASLERVNDILESLGPAHFEGQRAVYLRGHHRRLHGNLRNAHKLILRMAQQLEEIAANFEKADYALSKGKLFVMGEIDSTAIHPSDIDQGASADCYLLAPLAAIAQSHPQFIQDMITENEDGTYTVRFFNEETGKAEYVTVDPNDIPRDPNGNLIYAQYGDDGELWPAVIENAYAKWIDQRDTRDPWWSKLAEGLGFEGQDQYKLIDYDYMSVAMKQLTGNETTMYQPVNFSENLLVTNLQEGKIICAGSLHMTDSMNNSLYWGEDAQLTQNHDYYIIGYDTDTGMVELGNPWGWDEAHGRVTIPFEELQNSFSHIDVNQV